MWVGALWFLLRPDGNTRSIMIEGHADDSMPTKTALSCTGVVESAQSPYPCQDLKFRLRRRGQCGSIVERGAGADGRGECRVGSGDGMDGRYWEEDMGDRRGGARRGGGRSGKGGRETEKESNFYKGIVRQNKKPFATMTRAETGNLNSQSW